MTINCNQCGVGCNVTGLAAGTLVQCVNCGHTGRLPFGVTNQAWAHPGIAAVLSFFIPGLGQLYQARLISAIFWFLIVPVGYFCFFFPGVVFHLACIISALRG